MTRKTSRTRPHGQPSFYAHALAIIALGASAAFALPFTAEDPFQEKLRGGGYGTLYDFDNDGALDLAFTGGDSTRTFAFATWRNAGAGKWTRASVTRSASVLQPVGRICIGDADGNGKPDMLFFRNEPENQGRRNFLLQDFPATGAAGVNTASMLPLDSIPDASITKGYFRSPIGRVFMWWSDWASGRDYSVADYAPAGFDSLKRAAGLEGSLLIGDFNSDGAEDGIAIPGYNTTLDSVVYRASSPTGFKDKKISDLRIWSGTGSAGDYDNDGDLDFVICGMEQVGFGNSNRWYFFENTGNGFTQHEGPDDGPGFGFALFGDLDRDGDLDLVSGGSYVPTLLYRNTTAAKNLPPTVPGHPSVSGKGDSVRISWNRSQDDHTPAAGLTYNLRIGTKPGKDDLLFAGANPTTGTLLFPHFGSNAGDTATVYTILGPGTYFWAVQAIDNGLAASAFTAENSFEIKSDGTVSVREMRKPAPKAQGRARIGAGRTDALGRSGRALIPYRSGLAY